MQKTGPHPGTSLRAHAQEAHRRKQLSRLAGIEAEQGVLSTYTPTHKNQVV